LPERRPWLWESMDADLNSATSEVSLPLCNGFRAPIERLSVQLVAAATARAVAAIDDMRLKTWATVITEPCGLERDGGLPPGMGLLGRTTQISKEVVDDAVSNALKAMEAKREKKWRTMPTECPCTSKLHSGLPPAKGLPRRAAQLASDVIAATIDQVMAVSMANATASAATIVPSDEGDEQCSICLGNPERPVELPCGHVFCANCILRLVSEERSYQNRACPLCRGQIYSVAEDHADTESDDGFQITYRYSAFFGPLFLYCSVQSAHPAATGNTPRSEWEQDF